MSFLANAKMSEAAFKKRFLTKLEVYLDTAGFIAKKKLFSKGDRVFSKAEVLRFAGLSLDEMFRVLDRVALVQRRQRKKE